MWHGTVDSVQHNRNNQSGGGGSSAAVGDSAPEGRSVETGGTEEAGGNRLGMIQITSGQLLMLVTSLPVPMPMTRPTAPMRQPTPLMPLLHTQRTAMRLAAVVVTGNEVKLEVSGTTAAGDIGVQLSWDGGTTWTSAKTTPHSRPLIKSLHSWRCE